MVPPSQAPFLISFEMKQEPIFFVVADSLYSRQGETIMAVTVPNHAPDPTSCRSLHLIYKSLYSQPPPQTQHIPPFLVH